MSKRQSETEWELDRRKEEEDEQEMCVHVID